MNIHSRGPGTIKNLKEILLDYKDSNILVLTGRKSFESSGAEKVLKELLKNYKYKIFSDFEPNPKLDDLKRALTLARENETSLLLAVGGGSVLDMTKLIKGCYSIERDIESIIKKRIPIIDSKIPIIAIPTTAGSGSESTHFAVVYINKEKHSLADECLLPNQAILDGALLLSASKYQKTCSALDALSQAIESMWAQNSTNESRVISSKAISLCIENLYDFIDGSGDNETYQNMLEAANLAGQAINISKTTAPHAWSYGISMFHGIPHGHAVWLTLPKIFYLHATISEDNKDLNELKNIMTNLKNLLGIPSNNQIQNHFHKFLQTIEISYDLATDFNLSLEDREKLSKNVNLQRLSNNPIKFSEKQVKDIFSL